MVKEYVVPCKDPIDHYAEIYFDDKGCVRLSLEVDGMGASCNLVNLLSFIASKSELRQLLINALEGATP